MNTLTRLLVLTSLWLCTAVAQAGTHHYYYTDPQGTVLAKADASGTIIASYDYAPYGAAVASMSPAPNGPGYTGHVNDPDTGLVYMQARYYDPSIGRFLSVDPVGPSAGNGSNFNRFAYASDNPIANYDPNGLQSSDQTNCDIECKKVRQEEQERKNNEPFTGGGGTSPSSSGSISHKLFGAYKAIVNRLCNLPIGSCNVESDPLVAENKDEQQGMVAGGIIFDIAKMAASDGLSVESEESSLWSATESRTAVQNAFSHWAKHSSEFPEYQNAVQYVRGAKSFVSHPPEGTLIRVSTNGNTMFYNPSSNTFAVRSPNGAPRTMFRPTDGMNYWGRQK